MKGSMDEDFKRELKNLIIRSCDKEVEADDVNDDEGIFGEGTTLALDSLDALQVSMEIQQVYGVVLADSKELRRVFTSINALADYLKPE